MGKKIKLFHRETEVKVLLEVIAVYAILTLLFAGLYYFEPTITGFAIAENIGNETTINETLTESVEGIIETTTQETINQTALNKTLIEEKEKPARPEKTEPNVPPVWKSDVEEFTLKGKTVIDLNNYFSDKNNDTISYAVTTPEGINVEIVNNIVTLTPSASDFTASITFTASDGEKSTQKDITLIVPERIVIINLEYQSGTAYDADDDGIERTTGVIDFTVENTGFNWDVNEENLCTRWETYSVETGESTFVCYGSDICCQFVELLATKPTWNEPFFSNYGTYGAGFNNIISSQVLHVDYDLDVDDPFAEIYYSNWADSSASYYFEYIDFDNICVDTCALTGFNQSSYTLIFEIEDAILELDTLTYTIVETISKVLVDLVVEDNIGEESGSYKLYKGYVLIIDKEVEPDYYDIEVIPKEKVIEKLLIYNVNITEPLIGIIGVDNVSRKQIIRDVDVKKQYAIDASDLDFETATLTAVAEANSLFKCKQWDYDTEVCFGSWEKIKDLVAGEEYELTITPDDPGFVEGNSNISITELNITPKITSKKKDFKFGEDVELDFEYLEKEVLVNRGKWKEEYEVYEEETDKTEVELELLRGKIKDDEKLLSAAEKAIKKQKKKWQTVNETIETFVYDYDGNLEDIDVEIEELREGKFNIKLPKQRAFRAGKHTIRLEFTKDGITSTLEQEFTWGVLAINVNKSIYLPNQDAFIGIAVLDDNGDMVCNAKVTLEITDPLNQKTILTTADGDIKISPECRVYGVTDLPDYYTEYSVSGIGTYVMNLTAVTPNGIRSIQDNFTVASSVDFDVARKGPTRIYPPVPYNMSFTINANKNYNGIISEYVPASFAITPQADLTITTVGDTKILSWNVNLKKDETINLYYEFDAPPTSPEFYLLGALEIGTFTEARQWQIASDAFSDQGGGDHEGADYLISSDTNIGGYHFNIATFTINSGVTAYSTSTTNLTNNLTIEATRMSIKGRLIGNGSGHLGGVADGGNGEGPGNGTGATNRAGGGAGYGGVGGAGGGGGGVGGLTYGTSTGTDIEIGSGGGGGTDTGPGDDGGGKINLTTTSDLNISGEVSVNGSTGGEPTSGRDDAGGGGSGGGLYIRSGGSVDVSNGLLAARGGPGGDGPSTAQLGGGGGGGGRIKIFYTTTFINTNLVVNVSGAPGGTGTDGNGVAGAPGTNYTEKIVVVDNDPPTYASFGKNITDANIVVGSAIQFNVTISDAANNVNNWTFAWNATSGDTFNNITNSSTGLAVTSVIASVNHSLVGRSAGDEIGYIFCSSDDQDNTNCDTLRTFEVLAPADNTAPIANATLNKSLTAIRINDVINITANATDVGGGLDTCRFFLNDTSDGSYRTENKTLTGTDDQCSQNWTIDLAKGNVINFSVLINDTSTALAGGNTVLNDTIITVINTDPTQANIVNVTNRHYITNITINITPSTDADSDTLTYFWFRNTSASPTPVLVISGTTTTNLTTRITSGDGTYWYFVNVSDGEVNVTGDLWNLTLDSTIPIVNATLNQSLTNIGINEVINLTANATDNLGLSFGQIIVNDTGSVRTFSFALDGATSAEFSQNITVACNGGCVINFTARVNDTAGNFRTNDTIINVADKVNPVVNATLNESLTNIAQNDVINITANATDNIGLSFGQIIVNDTGGNRFFNFSLGGSTGTVQFSQNITISCSAGCVINFTARVNDTSNRFTTNDTIIEVAAAPDTIPPIVNATLNRSLTNIRRNDVINITANATDASGTLATCTFFINDTSTGSFRIEDKTLGGTEDQCSQNWTVSLTKGNVINFSVLINDTATPPNTAMNDTIITVVNTPPATPTIVFPDSGQIFNSIPIDLNVTVDADADGDAITINYYIDGKINGSVSGNLTFNASDGIYLLNISSFDTEDSSANTTTINFTLDLTVPIVNATLNESLTDIGINDVINLTANATDDRGLSFGQIIVNDTGSVRTFSFALDGATTAEFSQNITVSCDAGCVINFTARVNDSAGNFRTNDTIITVADKIDPIVNATLNKSSNIEINDVINLTANATDNIGLSFGQIIVNDSGLVRIFNFSLGGATTAQFSQNITISCSGCVINFTARVNDTSNRFTTNDTIITVLDTVKPRINASLNISQINLGQSVNMTAEVTDETGLSFCQFVINQTGGNQFFNKTVTGTNDECSQNFTIAFGAGSVINFTVIVNDTANNLNQSSQIVTVVSQIPVTNCTNLDQANANYTLTNDVNSGTTCFYVSAENITLDCRGFEINYSQSIKGYGINISNKNGTTIRSCDIRQADIASDTSNSFGVYILRSNKNNISNNTIVTKSSTSDVVRIDSSSSNNSINNNTITASGSAKGVYMTGTTSRNNSIYSNTITTDSGNGIDLFNNPRDNSIYSNTINTNSGIGVHLQARNNFVYSNTITTAAAQQASGIKLRAGNSKFNSVYSNTITTSGLRGYGIYFDLDAKDNTIYDNNITTTGSISHGIYLSEDADRNNIYGNNISTSDTKSYGIYVVDDSSSNNFYRNTISSLAAGIVLNGTPQTAAESTRFNNFTNDTIVPCTTGCASNYYDIILTANVTDIIFTNVSFNKSRILIVARDPSNPVEINNLTVKWFLTVNVTNSSNNNPIEGAEVNINDSFATNIFSGLTDSTGGIPVQTVTEFTINGSSFNSTKFFTSDTCIGIDNINVTCFTPYNISVNFTGYDTNDTSVDINRSIFVNISLSIVGVVNVAPTVAINNATFNVDPKAGADAQIFISFNATDADNLNEINGTDGGRVIINFTLGPPGVAQFRTETSCVNTTYDSANVVQFNCTVNMRYYDNNSADWIINITVIDSNDAAGINDSQTFTYNALAAFSLNTLIANEDANLNFSSANIGQNDVAAKSPILLNNTGNDDFDQINITAAALIEIGGSNTIAVGQFSVNITNNTLGAGLPLDGTPQTILSFPEDGQDANATLLHGPGISGETPPYPGVSNFNTKGNLSLYFFLDVPSGTVSATYNTTWNITLIDID